MKEKCFRSLKEKILFDLSGVHLSEPSEVHLFEPSRARSSSPAGHWCQLGLAPLTWELTLQKLACAGAMTTRLRVGFHAARLLCLGTQHLERLFFFFLFNGRSATHCRSCHVAPAGLLSVELKCSRRFLRAVSAVWHAGSWPL